MFPRWSDWNIQYTTQGLVKRRISKTLRVLILATVIVGAYYIRKDVRSGLRAVNALSRHKIKAGLLSLIDLMRKGISSLPDS